jgi:MFS family permease
MSEAQSLPAPAVRRRLLGTLFVGSALTRTGLIAVLTVAALAAEDMLGSATLSGLPAATATIGIAVGTPPIAWLMARSGRRAGLRAGLGIAAAGALLGGLAVNAGVFPLLVIGMFVFGAGIAAERLARYAAADITPPSRQAFAISLVVWAGTIGSVLGPVLLEPAKRLASSLDLEGLAGPFVIAAVASVVAVVVIDRLLRPDPLSFVTKQASDRLVGDRRSLVADPKARVAIVALLIGQVVMVLIMTMTPVHVRRAGEELGIVGLVIAAHTLGMFAFSPLTGFLSDRVGRVAVIVAGQVLLVVAAVLASFADGDERLLLVVSLYLLGLGWNFGFVAASALLTENARAENRVALQGAADFVVWTSAALASFSSGALLEAGSYATLSLIGASLVMVTAVMMIRYRAALAPVPS